MFFEVRRLELEPGAVVEDRAESSFHVLNVVEGGGLELTTDSGHRYVLAYAETLTIPAGVDAYRVRALGEGPVRYVKALVR
jgi:quercetin dioxygenase-like cupin family protein